MYCGRLVGIRPLEKQDLDVMTQLANDPRIRSMVVGWGWMVSRDAQEDWFLQSVRDPSTRRMTVVDKASGTAIGLTGLWDTDWHDRNALTAVKLLPDHGLRGAGSDAIMLVNAWTFFEVGLNRLYSSILPQNEASIRAYVDKCGWRVEGRDREAVFRDGQWHDLVRVGILRSDFEEHPGCDEYRSYITPTSRS